MIKIKTKLVVFQKSLLFLLTEIVNDDSKNINPNLNEEEMEDFELERPEPHNLHSYDENSTKLDDNSKESSVKSKYFLSDFIWLFIQ